MSVSDYYEGQPAGACTCGAMLVRVKAGDGTWNVTHGGTECPLVSVDQLQAVGSDDTE